MEPIKKVCAECSKEFWVIAQEQEFLTKMNLPHPVKCPSCRQARRLQDRGERQMYKTNCEQCGVQIIVSYNPEKETRKKLCKACYLDFFEKTQLVEQASTPTDPRPGQDGTQPLP